MQKKQVLGVNITVSSKPEILEFITRYVQHSFASKITPPLVIVTPNPEQLVEAHTSLPFAKLLNSADIALPDGVGVVFGLRVMHGTKICRISGIDFLSELVRLANKLHVPVGFVGGRNDVAHKALTTLQTSYIELHGWSEQPKEFASEKEIGVDDIGRIVHRIVESQTRFVFVGLGAPKQEFFINFLNKQLVKAHAGPVVLMAVGGSFDMLAGTLPRASGIFQYLGLEWLYRLWKEPWRGKRQTRLMTYLLLLGKQRFFH